MKRIGILLFFVFISAAASIVSAQQNLTFPFSSGDSRIKNIQAFDDRSGIAYTSEILLRTDDSGNSWRAIPLPKTAGETIAAVQFVHGLGYAILSDQKTADVVLVRSSDRGVSWSRWPVDLGPIAAADAEIGNADLTIDRSGELTLEFRVATSSNFKGALKFRSVDDGNTWQFLERSMVSGTSGEASLQTSGSWSLTAEGTCVRIKSGCIQETKIIAGGSDITPPQIKELARIEKEAAKREAEKTPMFALPPGGTTRISLNRGFDKCNAPTSAEMQTWWNTSPYYDVNIYMSGRNRTCAEQPNLNASWVNQVTAMGWGLIPTVVGYQSPCTASATTAKLNYDPVAAEQQGRGEADIAVTDANSLGLSTGSVLYYDMERYDPPSPDTLGCRAATVAFLKGWTDRIKELGYKSGVYGSPKNAQEDWVGLPPASKMDAIWMARWDNVPSVWTYVSFPVFPTNEWANHQRIKQYRGNVNETWGGLLFNIDVDISDAPVAGITIEKNKNADFDGDGKTDVSVFRPDTGVWYVLNSSTSVFTAAAFGIGTDIVTPGDYDGDGKTDYAVFRPSDGTWHLLTKAGFYTARQFGTNGDIPVAADFNGDGKTDVAVFRPSNGVWYISNSDSLGTYTFIQFGLSGDKPVQGDYDGDGKADIAVYRPSSGVWYALRSSDGGVTSTAFGIASDLPAQGDFDGDGKYDFVVYRDGIWYLLQTTAGFSAFQFGTAGDLPTTGDYDGDGKADAAVFRPSNGVWYMLRSQSGFTAVLFGLTGDKPIPNAYLPQ